MKRVGLIVGTAITLGMVAGCSLWQSIMKPKGGSDDDGKARPMTIHAFSDTLAATSLAGGDNALWVGTQRGLVHWDTRAATFTVLTTAEGLPGDKVSAVAADEKGGVWVMTSGGLAHQAKGAWTNFPSVPVGDFVTGMLEGGDGSLWAGGPEGLARLGKDGKWERFLGNVSVTALASVGPDLWVGLQGRGVARITKGNVIVYGPEQGCDTDVVRGLASTPLGLIAIGKDDKEQARLALWDGKRFWSYKVDAPTGVVLEWVRHIGSESLFGAGTHAYAMARASGDPAGGDVRLTPVAARPRKAPLTGPARADLPDPRTADVAPAAAPAPAPVAASAKPGATPAATAATAKGAPARPAIKKSGDEDEAPQKGEEAPALEVRKWGPTLPEGVTAVGPDGLALYVGTRFLGAARIDAETLTPFRTGDLAASAVRLTIACSARDNCYLATGAPRAWHYDGHSFDPAQVDPEAGSRVLAVIDQSLQPGGSAGVMAVHRGPKDPTLRMSTEAGGNWTPIGVQEVHVPEGVPDITFAVYAPNRHLWLGLDYVDNSGDREDYGAAEVLLDEGKVIYHRRFGSNVAAGPEHGYSIPNDVESCYFRSSQEAWFGTHTGVARVLDQEVKLYTENDGLESEFIHDVLEGPDKLIWVATSRGVGKFDGTRWSFPHEGEALRVRATSLVRDRNTVFVGSETGLLDVTPTAVDKLDARRGLLDDHVLNLALDKYKRLWVLTEKGLSIIDR